MKTFKVDVSKDVNNVHPPRFCLKCYALVADCVKRGSVGGGGGINVISSFKVIALLFIYVFYLILTLIHIFSNFTRAIG